MFTRTLSYTSHDIVFTPRGTRACCSAIIYALLPDQDSNFQRFCSDEMWHHYTRPLLEVIELDASAPGHVCTTVLDKRVDAPFFNQLQRVLKMRLFCSNGCGQSLGMPEFYLAMTSGCSALMIE